ncbi:MAG: S8 family serine peptidase [Erysipelotrichaceae bacterium]|nr:S8 family serine peptidase [Erysipelotrichaceae bacterium]
MSKLMKKLIGIFLVFVMFFSSVLSTNTVFAEDEGSEDGQVLSFEVIENDSERIANKLNTIDDDDEDNQKVFKGDVRVSIVLSGKATIDNGYSTESIALDPGAIAYRESLKDSQDEIAAVISRDVLEGEELDVVWNLTLAANIISANVPADKIDAIKNIPGVEDVFIENRYYPDLYSINEDDPNMSTATDMTYTQQAWAAGYTGIGSKVAIVDTGLDIEHQSFNSTAFDFAIQEYKSQTGNDVDLMDKKDVNKLWPSLNASQRTSGNSDEAYRNSKVPYAFNYIDRDFDIIHVNDTQGEHGSHVASIAAANKYIYNKSDDGSIELKNAISAVASQGNAPDAQLLVMKVFGKGGGAYDSDYFAAIEDAIVLGADSVNLSLGSSAAGFTTNSTYQDIIDNMVNVNIVWANSAGNNGTWADQTPLGYLYSEDTSLASGGSPATYSNTMSVASVNNKGFTGYSIDFMGYQIYYTETGYSNEPIRTIGGEHEFVYIDGVGTAEEFAKVADILEGKIAICNRGTTSFYQKANAAVEAGAIATIIVNNQSGTINMALDSYLYTQPAVSITLADGLIIKSLSEENQTDDGMKYWTGVMDVGETVGTMVDDSEYYTMSSFSSFGVPGNLSMKPEITTPGGNIYAVFGLNKNSSGQMLGGHDQYENMSGTSMAAPQLAGISAVMAQYVRENDLDAIAERLGITRRALIQSLLMSTATPLYEEASGSYYSILNQGSGLANVEAAINSNVVILMDSTAVDGVAKKDISVYAKDGKVKAELGDDPERSGRYTVEFTVNNITNKDLYYSLGGDFFTQDIFSYEGAEYLDTWTAPVFADLAWYVDGIRYVEDSVSFDFNDDGDGVFDGNDARAILDFVVGNRESLGDFEYADLDGDGTITTYDAYLALKLANSTNTIVPANGSINVRVEIQLSDDINAYDVNGAYVEGYLYATEKESEDGALGVVHSIPVLGFYGAWGESKVIDIGSYLEYEYELEDRPAYMSVSTALGDNVYGSRAQMFTGYHKALATSYVLGGNPLGVDFDNGTYYPERNAINSENTIEGARYSLIRSIVGTKYVLSDDQGNELGSRENVGNVNAAYYYANGNPPAWQNTSSTSKFDFKLNNLAEGEQIDLSLFGATEYAQKNGKIDWSEIDPSMELSLKIDNTAPSVDQIFGKRIFQEDENGELQDVIVVTIVASDNEYIAGAFVYDESGTDLFAEGSRANAKTKDIDTEEYVVIVDGSNVSDHLAIELWDYAANVTTVQLNLNKDELENAIDISLDEEEVTTVVGTSVKLTATLSPWGLPDQGVIWSSSDESIATVSEDGVVTGLKEGNATITAAAHADPNKTASCEFEFILVNRELNGFVWDENGEVWLSTFNTASLPHYDKLSESLRLPLASAAYGKDGTLYAASLDSDDLVSTLYVVNESTYEVSEVGPSQIGYMDMAPAPSLGDNILMGVYGTYCLLIDTDSGDYAGAFNLSRYTGGANLVGIAYEEPYYNSRYRAYVDYYFVLAENGTLYNIGFMPYNGSYANFAPQSMGSLGYTADIPYFQSLYFDGTDIYWSKYSNSDGIVDIIFINDVYYDGSIYKLGSFAEAVWPVGGLYNENEKELFAADRSVRDDEELDADSIFLDQIDPISFNVSSNKGSLNSVDSFVSREDVKTKVEDGSSDSEEFVVTLSADELTNNGLYEVTYDASVIKFARANSQLPYYAINNAQEGKFVFAFADLNGVAEDEVIAKLVFERLNDGRTDLGVAEKEKGSFIDHEAQPEEFDINIDYGDIVLQDRPEREADIPEGIWISPLTDPEYTGKALKQELRVYDHKTLLVENRDYTVTYKNNIKVGIATVTVKGKGNYTDSVSKTFNIVPAELNQSNTLVKLNKDAFAYNGKKQKPSISSVTYNGTKLKNKTDYTVTYQDANSKGVAGQDVWYNITITGKGNYAGEVIADYVISANLKPISSKTVSGIKSKTYTGQPVTQDIVIKGLVEDEDYVVEYYNNINVGTATINITGIGKYVGTIVKTFKITPITLKASNVNISGVPDEVKYCGECRPEMVLTYVNEVLAEGEDYTVTYKDNAKAGTASITFKGIGNYSGSITRKFKITAIDLTSNDVSIEQIADQPFQKGGNKPDVNIYDILNDTKLVKGTDYTLAYKNNTKQGSAKVTVKGKGNYRGSLTLNFVITPADLSALNASAPDKSFTNKKGNFKSTLTIKDVNGKKLTAGTDYAKSLVYSYADGTPVLANDIVPAGTSITVTAQGKGNYTGSVSATYRVVSSNISSAKVKVANQIYTGQPVLVDKAEITIKLNKETLNPEDFEIVSYTNNISKGTATLTIKGVGNYGGTKTVNFKIVRKSFLNALWTLFN